MSAGKPPRVVVLGGGSAGWITACLLHHEWAAKGGSITLVESADIGIIGVGEGSTPQLKAFFDHLGIAEADWMPVCDATYKLGIRFTGWSEEPGFGSYFHPFPCPVDLHTEPGFTRNCALRRQGADVPAHPDQWFLASVLASGGKQPKPAPGFPFPPSYGYHFDAHKLGSFLRDWAVRHGVVHRQAKVDRADLVENGDVAALVLEGGERIVGDVFVDCSGFRALIAEQTLGAKFLPFDENLFNDRAVVIPSAAAAHFRPQTEAIAMRAGWRWSIPLMSRTGNGYVYSSQHLSDDEAEAELRTALALAEGEPEARVLRMKVGRLENSWTANCLAAGLAQGFIEPLEATALHIMIATALEFAQAYEQGGFTPQHRDAFNRSIATRYEGIRDYIVGHYRLNRRTDTDYWHANAANDHLSDRLKAMITAWFTRTDMGDALIQAYGANPPYSLASWHCLFAGYGTFPPAQRLQPAAPEFRPANPAAVETMLAACATNFASAM